jgi:hypothetical protein
MIAIIIKIGEDRRQTYENTNSGYSCNLVSGIAGIELDVVPSLWTGRKC